jgi:hypothetical protein
MFKVNVSSQSSNHQRQTRMETGLPTSASQVSLSGFKQFQQHGLGFTAVRDAGVVKDSAIAVLVALKLAGTTLAASLEDRPVTAPAHRWRLRNSPAEARDRVDSIGTGRNREGVMTVIGRYALNIAQGSFSHPRLARTCLPAIAEPRLSPEEEREIDRAENEGWPSGIRVARPPAARRFDARLHPISIMAGSSGRSQEIIEKSGG